LRLGNVWAAMRWAVMVFKGGPVKVFFVVYGGNRSHDIYMSAYVANEPLHALTGQPFFAMAVNISVA